MLSRYFSIINKYLRRKDLKLKEDGGFTLVEVLVAFVIISIVTVVLIRGAMVSKDAIKLNMAKTKAAAVANEKIELIRTMNYEDIEQTALDANPSLDESGYDITYEVTPVNEGTGTYKQLEATILTDPMKTPITIITQIYPLGGQQSGGDTTPPASPSGLTADAAGPYSIDLDWNDNTIDPDLASYRVYGSTINGFVPGTENFINEVGSSSYTDTGLDSDTTYYYRVTAVDTSNNESDPSEQASTKTLKPDTTPPSAPTGLTADAVGPYSIDLDWNDNLESDIAVYKVYRSNDNGFIPDISNFLGESITSSYQDTVLNPETTYYYKVTAVDTSNNESDPSGQVSATGSTEISTPFIYDGAGDFYWKTNDTNWSYVNSWNLDLLEINGANYTNKYKNKSSIPAKPDGYWYIHYIGVYSDSHVEME
jgi:prepilin-type N-terminal cleavage/methylation domain-containing protein